ncbi:MAG: efflux RND transporter periplasmic adaptor subunit [Pseudomonadota bacterium]|nr:efflux RND transporter periplasmic adaptor subunit [Pseudomonadota bacterium]
MKSNLKVASVFAALVLLWLVSGLFSEPDAPVPNLLDAMTSVSDSSVPTVVVEEIRAERRSQRRTLRGKTASKQTASISTEISGIVVARPVERGARVAEGQLLCEIATDDRAALVSEALASVAQAEIEYEGALFLQNENLLAEAQVAQTAARLESARANLLRRELDLSRTKVRAPFSGVIESQPLVVGDFARVGDVCATLINLNPLLVEVSVSERDVGALRVGELASARTSTGQYLEGTITFVGSQSDNLTRTYLAEITIPNPDYQIRAGLTVVVDLPGETVKAHRVSPSLFTLSDSGELGLRTVNSEDQVEFYPVAILEDSPNGAWVTGLPERVRLITVGHEFVAVGQTVEARTAAAEATGVPN